MDLIEVAIICRAIRNQRLLRFEHGGLERIVAPYCVGISNKDSGVLRAIQVRGSSTRNGFNFGKLWSISQMRNSVVLGEAFEPDDPAYNPEDSAMKIILSRVDKRSQRTQSTPG